MNFPGISLSASFIRMGNRITCLAKLKKFFNSFNFSKSTVLESIAHG